MTSTSGRGLLLRGGRTKRFDHCGELPIDLAELKSCIFRGYRQAYARVRRLLWRMGGAKSFSMRARQRSWMISSRSALVVMFGSASS